MDNVNNIYHCSSNDGYLKDVELKATGCNKAGDVHAKQFHGSGNLKLIGDLLHHINAKIDDDIEVKWINPSTILLTKL